MKNGLSKTTKWGIALIAILALAMGINGAASANRASVVIADSNTFADTILLHDNINAISRLQATATPAATQAQQTPAATQAQQTPAATQPPAQATPAPQTGGTDTGVGGTEVDIASLPNGYFRYFGYLNNSVSGKYFISGQDIETGNNAVVASGLLMGDYVVAEGVVRGDGTMIARSIERVDDGNRSNPFLFSGVVDNTDGETWSISGVPVRVSEDLAESANVRQGSRVVVSGLTHGNNIWTADSISAAPSGVTGQDTSRFFYFTGKVSRSDPWTAAGIEFRMPEQNQITGTVSVSPTQAIRVGDLVSVRGAIDNEVWRADSVQLVGRPQSSLFMVGVVEDENPLTVRGMQFETNSATLTAGDLTRGTRVQILATPITKNRWMIVRAGEIGLNPNTNFGELALLQGEKQVTICHKPGGNPGKAYTIALPAQKARMHIIEHNDTIGACE